MKQEKMCVSEANARKYEENEISLQLPLKAISKHQNTEEKILI